MRGADTLSGGVRDDAGCNLAVERNLGALDLDDEVTGGLGDYRHLRALDETEVLQMVMKVTATTYLRDRAGLAVPQKRERHLLARDAGRRPRVRTTDRSLHACNRCVVHGGSHRVSFM